MAFPFATSRATQPAPTLFGERARWWGRGFASVWLVFLVPVVVSAYHRGGARDWAGIAVLLAFSGIYLAACLNFRSYVRSDRAASRSAVTLLLALLLVLAAGAVAALGADGLATSPYLAVVGVLVLGTRTAPFWIVAVAVVCEGLARTTAGWQHQHGIGYSVLGAGFGAWGMLLMVQRNVELLRSRVAKAELAVEHERNRFARDLHDILGHSLTVITVKAELAGRLVDLDVDRARRELADLERLSRDALTDVRRAVEGYREITLPGELALARAALVAAGIRAEVPNTVDEVDSALRELFAWTVREGVTNVVRHSGARCCRVTLSRDAVTVADDGPGRPGAGAAPAAEGHGSAGDGRGRGGDAFGTPAVGAGNGLRGLRERATAVGAELQAGPVASEGFRLTVARRVAR